MVAWTKRSRSPTNLRVNALNIPTGYMFQIVKKILSDHYRPPTSLRWKLRGDPQTAETVDIKDNPCSPFMSLQASTKKVLHASATTLLSKTKFHLHCLRRRRICCRLIKLHSIKGVRQHWDSIGLKGLHFVLHSCIFFDNQGILSENQ